MQIATTKRLPHNVVKRELREKPKALLYYLYLKAMKPRGRSIFNVCICSYNELLDLELLKTTDNTKDNRKAIRKLLDELVSATYIDYTVDKNNNLEIEVCITEPSKTSKDGFTQIPYSVVNNKNISCILVPTYISILHHDYQKGLCNPSMNTLAKYSGCSINTCKKRIEELQKLPLLQMDDVEKRKGGSKKNTNTFYTSNRHLLEDGDFFYRLIDVENTRFELPEKKLPTKKQQNELTIKSRLKQEKEPQLLEAY